MGKDYINKRLVVGGVIISILFSTMVMKLSNIQLLKHEEYINLALRQRSKEIVIDRPRGYIFDKNLIPLTNKSTTWTLLVPKILVKNDNDLYSKVLENTNLSYLDMEELLEKEDFILEIPLDKSFNTSNYSNVFMMKKINRYDPDNILSHVIGYINKIDNSGKSGLELTQNEFLQYKSKRTLLVEYDDKQSLLIGAKVVDHRREPTEPTSIVTTIDVDIQRQVEKIMDKYSINGSVIITDIQRANILAMASGPNIDQDHIYNYLENDDMSLYSRAVQIGYPPGSIFKIVVLLAALESDEEYINKEFFCRGFEEINSVKTNCSSAHGLINLKEAFSLSCNSTFIQIGREVGSEKIINMARRLNFGEKINIGLIEEIAGNLPTKEESIGAAIANISIGQGEILVTPLQISNLLMTILNMGTQKHIKLIEGISNDEGDIIKYMNIDEDKQVLDESHTNIIYEYLLDVVRNGTGKGINLDKEGSAGGKTGSAEAILKGKETVHGWFTGFYPATHPKYVITVLVEDGMSGSKSAAPVFEDICIYLSNNK